MIQKQIFFINNLIIITSIIFVFIFFVPIFTINIPLDYKIIENDLIVNTKNINMRKDLFVKLDNSTIIVNHNTGSFKINRYDIHGNKLILDVRQFNIDIENDLKIFYNFRKNVISYVLKKAA